MGSKVVSGCYVDQANNFRTGIHNKMKQPVQVYDGDGLRPGEQVEDTMPFQRGLYLYAGSREEEDRESREEDGISRMVWAVVMTDMRKDSFDALTNLPLPHKLDSLRIMPRDGEFEGVTWCNVILRGLSVNAADVVLTVQDNEGG